MKLFAPFRSAAADLALTRSSNILYKGKQYFDDVLYGFGAEKNENENRALEKEVRELREALARAERAGAPN